MAEGAAVSSLPAGAEARISWVCSTCSVAVHWLPGFEPPTGLPSGWLDHGDGLECLACARARVIDEAMAEAEIDRTTTSRERRSISATKALALVQFELERDPDRSDSEIVKAVRAGGGAMVSKAMIERGRAGVEPSPQPEPSPEPSPKSKRKRAGGRPRIAAHLRHRTVARELLANPQRSNRAVASAAGLLETTTLGSARLIARSVRIELEAEGRIEVYRAGRR